MVEYIAWIALGISLINLIIYIIWIKHNWKEPIVKIIIGFPEGELKTVKDLSFVELKLDVQIVNIGNEDCLLKDVKIYHDEKDLRGKSHKEIVSMIKLSAHTAKQFKVTFNPRYTPEKESINKGFDNIYIKVRDNKEKVFIERLYYSIDKKTKKINAWFEYE